MNVLLLVSLLQFTDGYHTIPLSALATTRWTHVCVTGLVTYVRVQRDGDVHVTMDDGITRVVLELITAVPLPHPRKGQRITACGVSRWDRYHGWAEVHPVLRWTPVSSSCSP
jgi:hypothetical protein